MFIKSFQIISNRYLCKSNIIKITFIIGICGAVTKIGALKNLTKFDSTFFNVHPKLAERLDPQIRAMLESTYEAFVDAGKHIIYISYITNMEPIITRLIRFQRMQN